MRQPSGHREDLLPLVDVGSRKFEHLCRDLVKPVFADVVRSNLKRRSGLPQFGVDVEGFNERQDPVVVISAKCYATVAAWHLRPWIEEFVKHLDGHWKGKNVRHFVLAVTHEFDDDPLNDAARAVVSVLDEKGIKFHLWSSRYISDLLRKTPHLVDRYFNEFWVRAISADISGAATPTEGAVPITGQSGVAGIDNLLKGIADQIARERDRLDKAVAERLERAVDTLRAGRTSPFETWLSEVRTNPDTWLALSSATRARALRASATLQLLRNDIPAAAALFDAADELHPAPDRCAQAMLDRYTGHAEDALASLDDPVTPHERELQATLLIETGRKADALAFIDGFVGDDVTPELLRLRAVARFARGRREAALSDATSAQRRAPDDASKSFTLATVKFLSAFVPGIEGRFGDKPDPLHPALLLETSGARNLLNEAIATFEHLAAATESPFRDAAEAWKLAGLLVHPDRGEDAARYAQVMLRREIPDPVAVAWLLNFGRLSHRGRVRRVYHRELRQGRGSATMLVVLARLIAGRDHVERGAALIRRYRSRFPRSQDLLDSWAVVFDDAGAPGENTFAAACRRFVKVGDCAPLVDFLASVDASVEDVASGCDLLAAKGAWRELDGLRDRVLSVGNLRAVELAALAALRSGKPRDCTSVLEAAAALADGGRLPRRLVHLRIRANEALGRYHNVVKDLLGLRNHDEDERVDANLIEAYARIGALPQLRQEAEQALEGDRLSADEALRVAQILKAYAPEVARRALVTATGDGIPAAAAGAVASLAAELGLRDLQERSIGILVAPENAGPHIIRFDGVEDVLSHIEASAQSYRDVFGEWLRGRAPAAMAMHSDVKTYAHLFLANADERRNQVQDAFPMLLRSGARKRAPPTIIGERPSLLLDVSALLLAHGLGVLGDVERAFDLRLAGAAPIALMAIEQTLSHADKDFVATCREALRPDGRTIHVAAEPPDDAVPLAAPAAPADLDTDVVARVLLQAFRAGHIDRDRLDRVLVELGATAPNGEAIAACVASTGAFMQLARRGILDAVSRGARLHMSSADREEIFRQLATAEHEHAERDVVTDLRNIVADRLLSGAWTVTAGATEPAERDAPRPAHLRSLQEVLAAVSEAPSLFWVEDRWLSHHRLDGGLDIVDVLDVLVRKDIIAPTRRADVHRRLSARGYAFLPVDADAIFAQVEAAPIEGGQIIESPALAGWRAWFVEALERAQYLDTTAYPDAEGGIQGEIRHALDLNGLPRDLLSRIWTSPNADRTERIARSEWVWTCLRSGNAPGWPEASDIVRRQNYAGLAAGWVLDLPIVAALGRDGATDFPGAEFMEWFSEAHLSAMCRADPAARDAAVAFVAQSLAHLLAPDAASPGGDSDGIADLHAREMAVRVKRFVDILPGDLGGRVTAHPGVGDRLGLHTVLVLTFGDGHEVPVAHLAEAYASGVAAQDAARADVLLADGSVATLSVAAGSRPLPEATLEAGSDRIELPAHVRALIHPDAATRTSALPSIPYLVDPRGGLERQKLVAVAEIATVEDRLKALEDLLDHDWFSVLQRLVSGIRSRRSLRREDLVLPPPESICAYLRLPLARTDDATIEAAMRSLRVDMGAEESAIRMAGLPIDLSPDVEAEMGGHFAAAADRPEPARGPPLFAALRVRALIASGLRGEALAPGIVALDAAVRETAGVFVALVRHGASLAIFDPAWMALDPTAFTSLLWSRAEALTRVLAAVGLAGDDVARWVRRQTAVDLDSQEAKRALPEWVRRLTIDLGVDVFTTALVGSLLAPGCRTGCAAESETVLRALSGTDGAAGLSPPLAVAAPPPPAPPRVWAARDAVGAWVEAGWTAEAHPFAERDAAAIVGKVLALGDDAATRELVPTLLATLAHGDIDEPLLARAREKLEDLNAESSLEPGSPAMFHALSARSIVLAKLDDTESMLGTLASRAKACAELWPDDVLTFLHADRPPETAFAILAAAAFTFALSLPRPREAQMETFASSLTVIVGMWPNARRAAIGRLDHLVRGLDAGSAAGVWPSLIALRRAT